MRQASPQQQQDNDLNIQLFELEISELSKIGPIVHDDMGSENWYFTAVRQYQDYPIDAIFYIKL